MPDLDNPKIFLTGANGQLGLAIQKLYPDAELADVDMFDITNHRNYDQVDWAQYDAIINAAAYTNVDGAETESYDTAWQVNVIGPALLARTAKKFDIPLVHVSTDYVFDGSQQEWSETDRFNPLSVYGQTKAAGDIAVLHAPKHYIVRTSWVIGQGKNFIKTIVGLADEKDSLTVVKDQIGRPTFTADLAQAIYHLLSSKSPFGTYNVTNDGTPASWAEIARAAVAASNEHCEIIEVSTAEYFKNKPQAAPRPAHSTLKLDKIKSTGFKPGDWRKVLEKYVKELE